MDPAPIRRWNPGFIALRWRHLFWGLPLLGLITGLVVHFLPIIRGTATGIVQVRPCSQSSSGAPIFTPSDAPQLLRSDAVLRRTVSALDLPLQWRLEESDCMTELRDAIQCDAIRGTALLEISVKGRSRAESERIWNALVTALNQNFESILNLHDQEGLDHLKAVVERQKADTESKRQALQDSMQTEDLLHRPNGLPVSRSRFDILKAEFEDSQRLLETLQIKMISDTMGCRFRENPVVIHQAPGTPVPVTLWDTLRPLVLRSSIGLGAGMVLAVVLAYLLELLFPRKASTP